MKVFICLGLFMASTLGAFAHTEVKSIACLSSREYITTLEYLRDQTQYGLEESASRNLAQKVSQGCTGASKRFIQVSTVLARAGLPAKEALQTGLKFSQASEEASTTFLEIFKGSFLSSMLDLDMGAALKIATELSASYEGNPKTVREDFERMVEFCHSQNSLDLPIQKCGLLAARVVKSGESFDFRISKHFTELFEYLTKESLTNLPSYEALELAEAVVKFGPEARANFILGFEFALAKKGLNATKKEAIAFGKTMASRSVKK